MATRRLVSALLFVLLGPAGAGALGLEAYTLGFQEAWTGNGYTPEAGYEVTGSETVPLDGFASFGVRIGLLDGFLAERAVVSVVPSLQVGFRYYLLYSSGRVVPTQIETAFGAEGTTLGVGSSRVITVRLPIPVAYELRFGGGGAVWMSLSPTFVFRIPGGDVAIRDESENLSAMYGFFYGGMRFLMPEVALGYRFSLSDHLDATISATYGVSILDIVDTTLPWYDQTRAAISVDLGFRPPLAGLFRDREEEQELPAGVEPFPGDSDTDSTE